MARDPESVKNRAVSIHAHEVLGLSHVLESLPPRVVKGLGHYAVNQMVENEDFNDLAEFLIREIGLAETAKLMRELSNVPPAGSV